MNARQYAALPCKTRRDALRCAFAARTLARKAVGDRRANLICDVVYFRQLAGRLS